jgi:hypothetical protein
MTARLIAVGSLKNVRVILMGVFDSSALKAEMPG